MALLYPASHLHLLHAAPVTPARRYGEPGCLRAREENKSSLIAGEGEVVCGRMRGAGRTVATAGGVTNGGGSGFLRVGTGPVMP